MPASDALFRLDGDVLQGTQTDSGTQTQGATGDAGEWTAGGRGKPAPAGGLSSFMVPMLLILAVFWFVMIGPERKNRKKREEMLGALKKGDKVMTTSGIYGTVIQVQESIVTVQIADGVRVRMSLQAVQGLEPSQARDEPAAEKAGKSQ